MVIFITERLKNLIEDEFLCELEELLSKKYGEVRSIKKFKTFLSFIGNHDKFITQFSMQLNKISTLLLVIKG